MKSGRAKPQIKGAVFGKIPKENDAPGARTFDAERIFQDEAKNRNHL
jgi:hypothetical protein